MSTNESLRLSETKKAIAQNDRRWSRNDFLQVHSREGTSGPMRINEMFNFYFVSTSQMRNCEELSKRCMNVKGTGLQFQDRYRVRKYLATLNEFKSSWIVSEKSQLVPWSSISEKSWRMGEVTQDYKRANAVQFFKKAQGNYILASLTL